MGGLLVRVDGVDVGRIGGERKFGALAAGRGHDGLEQGVDALQSLEGLDRVQRVQPLLRFRLVAFHVLRHRALPSPGQHHSPALIAANLCHARGSLAMADPRYWHAANA